MAQVTEAGLKAGRTYYGLLGFVVRCRLLGSWEFVTRKFRTGVYYHKDEDGTHVFLGKTRRGRHFYFHLTEAQLVVLDDSPSIELDSFSRLAA